MKLIFKKLSKIYALVTAFRNYLYEKGVLSSYKSSLSVISIGNITAGGSGKTPLCIFLAKALGERGYKPVILSRGYGGNYRGVHQVSMEDTAELCGDEPILMARSLGCPVVLSRKRKLGAKFIEDNNLGDLIILDDGLQHRALRRDIDIISVNIASEEDVKDLIEDRLIPFGKLREKRDPAFARADFVVLSSRVPQSLAPTPPRELMKIIPRSIVIVSSYFESKDVIDCVTGNALGLNKDVVAFCGIANPDSFFRSLQALGYKVKEKVIREDHYLFTESELRKLKEKHDGLPLVCTEKDAVRLKKSDSNGIYKLRGALRLIPEDAFIVQIEKKLKSL